MKYIIIDLDGTLCDCSHRVSFAQSGQWAEFHNFLGQDKPHKDVEWFVWNFTKIAESSKDTKIIALTGRNDLYRTETQKWLEGQGLAFSFDELLMRPKNDWSSDHELKPRILCEQVFGGDLEKMKAEVIFVLEDRDKVVTAWRDLGINCWQVRNGTY